MSRSDDKRRIRQRLWQNQEGKCYYCGKAFVSLYHPDTTIDHKIPQVEGGRFGKRNSALACEKCNNRKGPLNETEMYAAWVLGGWYLVDVLAEEKDKRLSLSCLMGKCKREIFIDGPPDRGAVTDSRYLYSIPQQSHPDTCEQSNPL